MNILERANALGVTGFLHPVEMEKLMELAAGRKVLEVGAYRGLSAWTMAQVAKSIVSIDTFRAATNGQDQKEEHTTLGEYLRATREFKNVTCIVGTSEQCAEIVGSGFGMIFLDATHTYEDVLADIDRWYPRLDAGGVMAFHDYKHGDYPGVTLAVHERFGPLPNHHVTLAWFIKP